MKLQELSAYREQHKDTNFVYHCDLFSKPIWGDMGEDWASITLTIQQDHWHLSFIRTQNGEPYPLAKTVSNVIDAYEKQLSDEQVFDLLSMHQLLHDFESSISKEQE